MKTINISYNIPGNLVTFIYTHGVYREVWECKINEVLETMINIADRFYQCYGLEITFQIN